MIKADDAAFAGGFGRGNGLTKREYFAALAMQGMLANPHEKRQYPDIADYAVKARVAADALIAELNRASREVEGTQTA